MSILIDVDEVRAKVRGADHGGLNLRDTARRLATGDTVVRALIDHGHLTTFETVHPINRCPVVVVSAAEVARFRQKYVSLFTLAKQRGKHFRVVRK
jgi:hypothetical protein